MAVTDRQQDRRRTRNRVLMLTSVLLVAGIAVSWFLDPQAFTFFGGGLEVATEPAGAEVRVDGELVGQSPVRVSNLPVGTHLLRLTHPYRLELVEEIEITRGAKLEISRVLPEAFGSLALMSNPRGSTITLDGEPLADKAPLTIERIAAGVHRVTASFYRHRDVSEDVEVLPGKRASVVLDLPLIPHGSLTINTRPPGAQIDVIGLDTPYQRGMELPVGEYSVEVSAADHAPGSRRVQVGTGDNVYAITLQRPDAALEITTSPADAEVTLEYRLDGEYRTRRYAPGMTLPMGSVTVTARAGGHRTQRRQLDLDADGVRTHLTLERFDVTPGETFRDPLESGGQGPLLVIVPSGRFAMGDSAGVGAGDELPVHEVRLTQPFAAGVHEITVAEFARFRRARGGDYEAPEESSPEHPAVDLGPADALAYVRWLSEETGHAYRLPSEAEWEYMARAGATGSYPDGEDPLTLCRHANIADQSTRKRYMTWEVAECTDGHALMAPVGSFEANAFGLHDVLGNAAEWVADCWSDNYEDAPADGSPVRGERSCYRVFRGGSWDSQPQTVRFSYRQSSDRGNDDRGLRVVREL